MNVVLNWETIYQKSPDSQIALTDHKKINYLTCGVQEAGLQNQLLLLIGLQFQGFKIMHENIESNLV